jgi:hypothetical protein
MFGRGFPLHIRDFDSQPLQWAICEPDMWLLLLLLDQKCYSRIAFPSEFESRIILWYAFVFVSLLFSSKIYDSDVLLLQVPQILSWLTIAIASPSLVLLFHFPHTSHAWKSWKRMTIRQVFPEIHLMLQVIEESTFSINTWNNNLTPGIMTKVTHDKKRNLNVICISKTAKRGRFLSYSQIYYTVMFVVVVSKWSDKSS